MFTRLLHLFRTRKNDNARDPRMAERKVARMVDIFNIAVGWKLLFRPPYNNRAHAYVRVCVCVTHTHKRPGALIFSVYAIRAAQRANRIRKSSLSLFVSRRVRIYALPPPRFFDPFYFPPWLYFLMRKRCSPSVLFASTIRRTVDSITQLGDCFFLFTHLSIVTQNLFFPPTADDDT